jgi:ABC-2 type transport system permease protein
VVVITTRATGTPRWVPEWLGLLSTATGLVFMLCHAITDREQEIRRMYGIVAAVFLIAAIVSGVVPGPSGDTGIAKYTGYYFMPWGVMAALLSLLFAVPFLRHETEETYRTYSLVALAVLGAVLCAAAVILVLKPGFPVGTQVAMALLGLGFLCVYLSQVDASDGIGYAVAFLLGAVGAVALFVAFAWAVFPTVLYDGPRVLRLPNQSLDRWQVAGRVLVILAFLGVTALGAFGRFPKWLRGALGLAGLATAGVFIYASFGAPVHSSPAPFLVPRGLILAAIGAVYLAIGLGTCSDSQFVTLTRRELSSYFFTPIGYLVLGGIAGCQWLSYWQFYNTLSESGLSGQSIPEPIVRYYLFDLIPVICVVLSVPALTMRLMSEEKRTGSLEVLLTSPVSEWSIILSKFLATWVFFMLCWLPTGLFLVAVRVEAGTDFDYKPLLSFYAALAVCSAAFISCGLFFSTLTRNQVIAAVFTFAVLVLSVVCYFVKQFKMGLDPNVKLFLTRLSFIDIWFESLRGQLPLRDVIVWASAAVFGLFLSVKVLEARKWN